MYAEYNYDVCFDFQSVVVKMLVENEEFLMVDEWALAKGQQFECISIIGVAECMSVCFVRLNNTHAPLRCDFVDCLVCSSESLVMAMKSIMSQMRMHDLQRRKTNIQ